MPRQGKYYSVCPSSSVRGQRRRANLMNPRSKLRGRCLAAVLLCLAAFGEAQAQDGRHRPGTRLDFSREAAWLADDAAVSSWAAGALHRRLGLAPATGSRSWRAAPPARLHHLPPCPDPRRAARGSQGIPIAPERRPQPVHLLGHHTPFPDPPSADPTLGLDDVLAAAHASDAHPPTGRLVFWPDGGELKLSYELEGWFLKDEETGFERVYVDAHKGAVLQRLFADTPGAQPPRVRLRRRLPRSQGSPRGRLAAFPTTGATRHEETYPK